MNDIATAVDGGRTLTSAWIETLKNRSAHRVSSVALSRVRGLKLKLFYCI